MARTGNVEKLYAKAQRKEKHKLAKKKSGCFLCALRFFFTLRLCVKLFVSLQRDSSKLPRLLLDTLLLLVACFIAEVCFDCLSFSLG